MDIPDAEAANRFVGRFDAESIRFRASAPESQAVVVLGGSPYSYFRYEAHLASLAALQVYDELATQFAELFGRRYEAIETYRMDDAQFAFLMLGSFATKAKDAVDHLRSAGWKIGLLRPRLYRPFPEPAIRSALRGKQGVAVIDQNLSMGKGGVLHAELASVLYGHGDMPPILASFIGGLGGRDISAEEFFEMATSLRNAVNEQSTPPPRLLYTENELREVRKLQAIAHVERNPGEQP